MQCLSPVYAVMRPDPLKPGKNQVVFGFDAYTSVKDNPHSDWQAIMLPCGRCLSCKMRKAKEWSIRAIHEASLYDENCFLTLTYNDSNLPPDYSVSVRAVQLFLKRLRKKIAPAKVRFLACGEYGSINGRPHYHLCLFGYCPDDLVDMSGYGISKLYFSPTISKLWPYGFHSVGDLTAKSAAYVARYTVKKAPFVDKVRPDGRHPEFLTCSRRPGLGHGWFDKYADDIYNYDKVILPDGSIARPPKRYDAWMQSLSPVRMSKIKAHRLELAKTSGLTDETIRIKTLTEIMEQKCSKFKRALEDAENDT